MAASKSNANARRMLEMQLRNANDQSEAKCEMDPDGHAHYPAYRHLIRKQSHSFRSASRLLGEPLVHDIVDDSLLH